MNVNSQNKRIEKLESELRNFREFLLPNISLLFDCLGLELVNTKGYVNVVHYEKDKKTITIQNNIDAWGRDYLDQLSNFRTEKNKEWEMKKGALKK